MEDRATLEKIYAIMRRLLLVKMDGLNPIPRKGTTRHECYRALYEIQELLETRRYFGKHLPQSKADRIRAMSDEELAAWIETFAPSGTFQFWLNGKTWLQWLRQEAGRDGRAD